MIVYIKEIKCNNELINLDKIPVKFNKEILSKIILKINKFFNIINVKFIDGKYILNIPNIESKNVCRKIKTQLKKISKRSSSKIIIALSEKMKKYEYEFKEYKIIKQKDISYYMVEEIIKYIINVSKEDIKLELQDIYILSNEYNSRTNILINYLLEKAKTTNIITKQIEKYENLEETIYNNNKIIISVSNNKKKSLKKAKIIINMDFDNKEISKYVIYRNAIIINLSDNKINKLRVFNGIIINNIEIEFKSKLKIIDELKEQFKTADLYQTIENSNIRYEEYANNTKKNGVNIKNIYGNNGIISVKEIENSVKNLDKCVNLD